MRRLNVLLVMAAMIALVQPTDANAATNPGITPGPSWYHPTLAQAKSVELGQTVGPTAYTSYGKLTITGWTTSGKYTVPITKVVYVSPAGVMGANLVHPDSWYNPFSWDWGHILGSTWNSIWNSRIKGATRGVVASVSIDMATKLLARGAELAISPQGYVAIAVGTCFSTLLFPN